MLENDLGALGRAGLRYKNLATRNRTRDHLIAARLYSQMLCQLSYSRRCQPAETRDLRRWRNRVTKR